MCQKAECLLKLSMAVLVLAAMCLSANQAWPFEQNSSELLGRLNSDRWSERYSAYKQLVAEKEELKKPSARKALVELLDKENHVMESLVRKTHQGIDAEYGEGYSEYIAMLLGTVDLIADWNDPREVCVIARSSYNPESALAAKIAQKGSSIVPCLIQMAGSAFSPHRYQAVPILVTLLSSRGDHLPPATAREVRQTIIITLHDSDPSVRQVTVEALGRSGNPDMIPFLSKVARSDPASYSTAPGKRTFPIREAAASAISSIRERSPGRRVGRISNLGIPCKALMVGNLLDSACRTRILACFGPFQAP